MSIKILTVDDSKSVRIIVKKAFRDYDVEVLEAANGVEGLSMASREQPDLILLDITMPVMDGIEMLTKLKGDPALNSIPVIMLTAEAGKDNVLKIAKIGVRDYIVKPFKEGAMIEKATRVIDLRPLDQRDKGPRSINDATDILVVEDKPAIIEQISKGLSHLPWTIHSAHSNGEAIDACSASTPDVIIISLSLPKDSALELFRVLRSNAQTKYIPIFGLAVKTDAVSQEEAQKAGVTTIITKPIDFNELENRITKALNLDTSARYFELRSDVLIVKLPGGNNTSTLNELAVHMPKKLTEAVDNGIGVVAFEFSNIQVLDMGVIKSIMESADKCKELSLSHVLVGPDKVAEQCKQFQETQGWSFVKTLDDALSQAV